jgi:hypothetical protein
VSRRLLLAALVAGAAAVPVAPASAYCDDAHPCVTTCDKVEGQYDAVTRKFGIPLPPFPLMCPQN